MGCHARLTVAATLVRDGVRVVDVGTDHAYLPVQLVREGKCPSAIACDLRQGPLDNARKHVEEAGLSDRIELRLGNGLAPIEPEEAEDICICGMGGELIAEILDAARWVQDPGKHLVLQPMTAADDLRRYLAENGFSVDREELVRDAGRLYTLLSVTWTGEKRAYPEAYWWAGTVSVRQPLGEEYLRRQLSRVEKQIASLAQAADPERRAARDGLRSVAEELRRRLADQEGCSCSE